MIQYNNTPAACGTGPGAAQSQSSPMLSRVIDLRETQSTTSRLLSELEGRIESVLGPHPPTEVSKDRAARSSPSPLCGELDDRIASQLDINSHVGALIERLTL